MMFVYEKRQILVTVNFSSDIMETKKSETFWSDKKATVKHEFCIWQKYLKEQRGKEIYSKMKENLLLADLL